MTVTRWTGCCHGCRHERELETRYDRGARTLCDECFARTVPTTSSTVDFQVSGVPVAPQASVVSADACGASYALSSYAKPSASASALYSSPETADEKAKNPTSAPDRELGFADELVVAYRQGRLEPLWTPLPPLPPNTPPLARQVAEDFRLVLSCRRAAGNNEPALYTTRWVAARIGSWHTAVSGALKFLRQAGVLELRDPPAKWKNYGGGRRAHFYLPAGFDPTAPVPLEAGAVSVEAQPVRQPPVKPVAEDDDIDAVPEAELRGDAHRTAVDDSPGVPAAPGHSADGRHAAKPSRGDGWDLDYLASIEPEDQR